MPRFLVAENSIVTPLHGDFSLPVNESSSNLMPRPNPTFYVMII